MQLHSVYHKEENMLIDKNFYRLNNVKWFMSFLFFVMLPINVIVYLVGANSTFSDISNSIQSVFLNEVLKRDYLRIHDAMATYILYNQGKYNNLNS